MGSEAVKKLPATPKETVSRFNSTNSISRLVRPFKCPSTARSSDKPARKRRKINYVEADSADVNGDDGAFVSEDRQPLTPRDANRYPVFKVKDKDAMFRQRFLVPMRNKRTGEYDALRPAPLLGMRLGAVFVAKPLHDPSGEFAIVLYDPTLDDKAAVVDKAAKEEDEKKKAEGKEVDAIKLDAPIVHKSLADILGLKKKVEERPRVPVVIDPRLAKVLRPHQIEGVKVRVDFANHIDSSLTSLVPISLHYRADRPTSKWMYHGRRNGSG